MFNFFIKEHKELLAIEKIQMKTRNSYFDKVKGFAIILVVVGHAIQSTGVDIDSNVLFRLIYSFHMPLFMLISGLIAYKKDGIYDHQWLKKRFLSLGIPFIVWIAIPFLTQKRSWSEFPEYVVLVLKSPDYGLWFLWVLFLNCVMLYLIYKISRLFKSRLLWDISMEICAIVLCLMVWIICKWFWYIGIALLKQHCIYYFAGFFIRKYKHTLNKYKWIIAIMATIIWIVMVPYWRRIDYPAIFSIDFVSDLIKAHKNVFSLIFNYTVSFAGIGMILSFIYIIRNMKFAIVLEKFGKRTIEIYILQWYFFPIFTFSSYVIQVCSNVFMGLVGPYLISEIYERNLERRLLYGKASKYSNTKADEYVIK